MRRQFYFICNLRWTFTHWDRNLLDMCNSECFPTLLRWPRLNLKHQKLHSLSSCCRPNGRSKIVVSANRSNKLPLIDWRRGDLSTRRTCVYCVFVCGRTLLLEKTQSSNVSHEAILCIYCTLLRPTVCSIGTITLISLYLPIQRKAHTRKWNKRHKRLAL